MGGFFARLLGGDRNQEAQPNRPSRVSEQDKAILVSSLEFRLYVVYNCASCLCEPTIAFLPVVIEAAERQTAQVSEESKRL